MEREPAVASAMTWSSTYLCFDSLADTRKKKPHMLRSDDRELR